MKDNQAKYPQLRFKGFTDPWDKRYLGDYVVDYTEKTTQENQFPVLTSSQQQGIVLQSEYFSDRQVTTDENIGYFVLPRGYFTYRSRSDNNIFVFNRNDIIDKGIISYFYPVFGLINADSNFFLRRINNGLNRQLAIAAEGTGQHVLSLKKFKKMETRFPSLPEQKQIGEFLECLDDLITVNQCKLAKLKELKQGYLQKLFPKNGAKVPELRFAGFADAWEQRQLGEYVVDYVEKTTIPNQFPVLTSSQQQGVILQEDYFTNRQVTTNDNIGYFILPKGYFTYRSRSDNDVFVFNRNDIIDKGIISHFYPVFSLKNADSDFFLKRVNNGIQRQLSIQAEGTGQHVLSLKKFKNIDTLFPIEIEQVKIGKLLNRIDQLIASNQRKLEKLQELKKGYLQKMFC